MPNRQKLPNNSLKNKQPCNNCGQFHTHKSDILTKLKNLPFYRFKDIYKQEFEKYKIAKQRNQKTSTLPLWIHQHSEVMKQKNSYFHALSHSSLNESSNMCKQKQTNQEDNGMDSKKLFTVKKAIVKKQHYISSMSSVQQRTRKLNHAINSSFQQNSSSSNDQSLQTSYNNRKQNYSIYSGNKSKISTTIHKKSDVWHSFVEKKSRKVDRSQGLINEVNIFEYKNQQEQNNFRPLIRENEKSDDLDSVQNNQNDSNPTIDYSKFDASTVKPLEEKKFQQTSISKQPKIVKTPLYNIEVYLDNWK